MLGDVNVSLIKTVKGQTIYLRTTPTCRGRTAASTWCRARRACSRAARIALYIEGRGKDDQWQDPPTSSRRSSSTRCGNEMAKQATRGHGGMDFLEDYRLIECLRAGTADRHERLRCRGAERGRAT